MSLKQPAIAMAAVGLCTVIGAAPASAQENCQFMYQRTMESYQAQSPYYNQMLNHYNERCLMSGGSSQPAWEGRHSYYGYEQDGRGYNNDRWQRRGWGW
jgi:hypothetical protein